MIERMEIYTKKFDDASWIQWAVFPPTMTEDEILDYCERHLDWPMEGYYGHPGGYFSERASVFYQGTRALVTQRCGYDI